MKIDSTSAVRSGPARRAGRAAVVRGDSFAAHIEKQERGSGVRGVPAAQAVDAAFVVQEVGDATDGRAEARARGEAILDRLNDIRLGLLAGAVSRAGLRELEAAVREARTGVRDPGLHEVLDEIDLRAKIELAKLNRAA